MEMRMLSRFVTFLVLLTAVGPWSHAQSEANEVKGTGTPGQIPVWLNPHRQGDSVMTQNADGSINVSVTSKIGLFADTSNALDGATALFGNQTALTGVTFGVQGFSVSPNGVGVQGVSNATTGNGGSGVAGFFNGTSGFGNGVYGQTSSTGGSGGFFQTTASSGNALTAVATTTTGSAAGIYAQTSCPTCPAVFGQQLGTTGFGAAIQGLNASVQGVGTSGTATATTGFTAGLYGETNSPSGVVALLRSQAPGGAGHSIITGQVGVGFAATDVFRVDDTGKGFFDGGTQTGGADFAESVAVSRGPVPSEPGDLLVLDVSANRQLTLAAQPYSTLVAGIYSTKPGVLATPHKMTDSGSGGEIPLAIVGIVPCKVSAENGSVQRGDLLVTSSTPGYAMKGTDRSRMLGAIVGKAMEPLEKGTGIIQVLVTLQ
jgi:hypothetical protein